MTEHKETAAEHRAAERHAAEEEKAAVDKAAHDRAVVRKPSLASAAASGDPAVQKLLADRQTAQMNRDALGDNGEAVKEADEQLAAIDKKLAELGYE